MEFITLKIADFSSTTLGKITAKTIDEHKNMFETFSDLQNLLLFSVGSLQGHNDQPGAFSILDIRAVLAGDGDVAKAIEIVILDLEESSHLEVDRLGLLIQLWIRDSSLEKMLLQSVFKSSALGSDLRSKVFQRIADWILSR